MELNNSFYFSHWQSYLVDTIIFAMLTVRLHTLKNLSLREQWQYSGFSKKTPALSLWVFIVVLLARVLTIVLGNILCLWLLGSKKWENLVLLLSFLNSLLTVQISTIKVFIAMISVVFEYCTTQLVLGVMTHKFHRSWLCTIVERIVVSF